jgi:lipoprotein-anchoring transpeptidase ErfK/SrfK
VHVARVSTGRPGWETPPGRYRVLRRVADETMRASSLSGPGGLVANYEVKNVRWTQYFSLDGMALHENYWSPRDRFGVPSSHGCAGMTPEDARFFWDWAALGTPIYAHI